MKWQRVAVVLALALLSPVSYGFINPEFTPVHLCREAEGIVWLHFTGVDGDGIATAEVSKVIKGEAPGKTLKFDLMAGAFEYKGEKLKKMIEGNERDATLFLGDFGAGMEGGGMDNVPRALMHIGKDWVVVSSYEEGSWDVDDIDERLLGTWAGSDTMLRRAIGYIMADESAEVPTTSGAEWDKPIAGPPVEGKVSGAEVVRLSKEGPVTLYIARKDGDLLLQYDKKAKQFSEVTAKSGLKSQSVRYAWGDVNRDGLSDLVSWTGEKLMIHEQVKDGGFQSKVCDLGERAKDGCSSLAIVDCGASGVQVLMEGKGVPVLIGEKKAGGYVIEPIASEMKKEMKEAVGDHTTCIAADFDGDSFVDVLQVGEGAGLLYKGTGAGQFASPVVSRVAWGKSGTIAAIGDFDMDGQFDVYTSSEDGNALWHNVGKGEFESYITMSGEIEYISKRGANGATTADINGDGRQDVLITYDAVPLQIFFNRGFNSFGHDHLLDLADNDLLPGVTGGTQAACLGDMNGDGAMDMFVILHDGKSWLLPLRVRGDAIPAVLVSVDGKGGNVGPVRVTAWQNVRCIGSYEAEAGEGDIVLGMQEAGPMKIQWQFPGKKVQSQDVFVEDQPMQVIIGSGKE